MKGAREAHGYSSRQDLRGDWKRYQEQSAGGKPGARVANFFESQRHQRSRGWQHGQDVAGQFIQENRKEDQAENQPGEEEGAAGFTPTRAAEQQRRERRPWQQAGGKDRNVEPPRLGVTERGRSQAAEVLFNEEDLHELAAISQIDQHVPGKHDHEKRQPDPRGEQIAEAAAGGERNRQRDRAKAFRQNRQRQ